MKTARTEGSTVFDRDFVSAVLTWSDSNPRSLPWRVDGARERRDPWSVLVAETMLAQTQATRVAQVYPSFLERFPTALAMAQSTKSEVLERWIGLGYYRRAVRLWESSRAVVSNYPKLVPGDLSGAPPASWCRTIYGLRGSGAGLRRSGGARGCECVTGSSQGNRWICTDAC